MSKELVLIESLNPATANLMVEEHGSKDSYLSGIFMQADIVNGNQRVYPLDEIKNAVDGVMKRVTEGYTVYGELNHPDNLQIDLNNVSHIITEMKMDGANAVGKAKLLNTPKGQIVKAIIDGGGKLGVSSRGSGNVVEGKVSSFSLVTVDIVATPSAPNAYPAHVMEALMDNKKVMSLAETVVADAEAQKYFRKELAKFFGELTGQELKPVTEATKGMEDFEEALAACKTEADYVKLARNKDLSEKQLLALLAKSGKK